MKRFAITSFPLENKTIFLRVDYNVPLKNNKVIDNTKLKSSLQTIKFLLEKNCKIIIATHLGRPDGKVDSQFKVSPLVKELQKLLPKIKINQLNNCIGKKVKKDIGRGNNKELFFLENLRFFKEEKENDLAFAHNLADLADIYINEAFSVSHRKHASLQAITNFLPSLAGFAVEKEIYYLNQALHPKKPVVWLIGGAKLDKINLIERTLKKADYVLLGGALSFAFLKAQGISVGMSKIDCNSIETAKKILQKKRYKKKIILPLDFNVTEIPYSKVKSKIVKYNQIAPNQAALDLGPETIKLFKRYLRKGHTIVWNGPLGLYEQTKFATATKEIGKLIGQLTALSISGGGETAEAIKKFHISDKIDHVSNGGGATLSFLAGEKMPAITALEENYNKFNKKINKKLSK